MYFKVAIWSQANRRTKYISISATNHTGWLPHWPHYSLAPSSSSPPSCWASCWAAEIIHKNWQKWHSDPCVQELHFEWGSKCDVNEEIHLSGYHHHIHMVGKFPISQEKERFDRTVHGYDCSWGVSKTLFRFLILRRASMTSSAPTSNLRCTWRDAWRQPFSQPLPLLSYSSPSPTCPSSSRKRYWSSEPPSACSCSLQCEQNFPF